MPKKISELLSIVKAGGGISIDAESYRQSELINLVQNSYEKTTIIMRNSSPKRTSELEEIARKSFGKVIFEF
ncbi:hypothetical protein [Marinifilum sp. D714]|uniref:hypothetical protein n=1 Tax=Marinifilum sp. D714 TaxID=2937523 RepID=UPI0027CDFBC6|nr:hypothetical protein [Marinifilum sp. D714]MDQ2177079.1 hypothetical protein [Marinifilum sp. D714]